MILTGAGGSAVFRESVPILVAVSVVLGWLYDNTGGPLPVVMVTHASHNVPAFGNVTDDLPAAFGVLSGDATFDLRCGSPVALYAGSQTSTRDGTVPDISGHLSERLPRRANHAD